MEPNIVKKRAKKHAVYWSAIRADFGCEKLLKLGARTMNLCGLYSILARLALFVKDRFLDQNISKKASLLEPEHLQKAQKW